MLKFSLVLLLFSICFNALALFKKDEDPVFKQLTDVDFNALCDVATQTQRYLNHHYDDKYAVHGGTVLLPFSNTNRIKQSLAFICDTYQQDLAAGRPTRLKKPAFLKQHFDFYRWLPDKQKANAIANTSTHSRKSDMLNAIPQDQIFLTKYYTKLLRGSTHRTGEYSQALYALPYDESELSLMEAEQQKSVLTRYQYSRQQIINGVLLDKNLAKPLIWISEEALHDVLLQGTGVLLVDGKVRYFNVHRNNGVAYNYSIGKREQARYWYFAEVPSILGYGKSIKEKIAIKPYVTFAGNVEQLGLGQLILVTNDNKAKHPKGGPFARMGVLADEGGAFKDNLFQIDYLVGSYYGWKDYHQANKDLPDYTNAWLLLKK